jgi:ribosomal protein S18 acetylase RimI-like enzyme
MVDEEDLEAASDMNVFLQHNALDQTKKGVSRTFILRDEKGDDPNRALGYFSTSVAHLKSEEMPKVVSSKMTIPVFVLLRLAIDKEFQGRGYGSKLFIHILHQLTQLASQTGVYALVLEPLNEQVRGFYERFGLCSLPGDLARMYIRVKDVESWLNQRTQATPST